MMLQDSANRCPHRTNVPDRAPRKGSSLLEVLITMSATSMVFMVVVSVIHQSFRLGSQQMRRSSDDATLESLNANWRTDVAQTKTIAWQDERTLEVTNRKGDVVSYTVESERVIRKSDTSSQAFRMSEFYDFQWEREKDIAALHVRRRPIEKADPIEFRVWSLDVRDSQTPRDQASGRDAAIDEKPQDNSPEEPVEIKEVSDEP